ncbi:hypothetical protein CPter91_3244 [Collimonas pratensis]|uniref:Uncharacterized protein n=1 Tax=Collimonas pratensis TaxID=279113 RepID=A0A127Q6B9_9BURK|nr:hypothetical protein CPter91_3244 [Collimonas pratensis]
MSNFCTGKFLNFAAKTKPITVLPKAYLLKNLRDGLDQISEKYATKKSSFSINIQTFFASA